MNTDNAFIRQLRSQWEKDTAAMTKIFETLGNGKALTEVAPGRNTVSYLLGHMVAVHDHMIEALDAGERMYAGLDAQFLTAADSKENYPSYDELLDQWKKVNTFLSAAIAKQTEQDWLSRHHYITDADFEKEPHRNRLAILISRLTHMSTHLGQLKLIK